jgi:hypothetical protein
MYLESGGNMKLFISALLGAVVLSGCVAVPYYPAEPVYGGTVVVQPDHGHRHYRDRDGDGVPNRRDHRPNNPYRY